MRYKPLCYFRCSSCTAGSSIKQRKKQLNVTVSLSVTYLGSPLSMSWLFAYGTSPFSLPEISTATSIIGVVLVVGCTGTVGIGVGFGRLGLGHVRSAVKVDLPCILMLS